MTIEINGMAHVILTVDICLRTPRGPPGCGLSRPTWSLVKGSSARVSPIRLAIVVRRRFFGIFWPLFLAGSERLRDNRRMTDAGS